jgi:hypothetical protein
MKSKIQELVSDKTDKIDYEEVLKRFPWIIEKGKNCVISPDSDGLLCGLLMSHYLNWKIVGFYDGKVMILKNGLEPKNCVFLDMEIFRREVKSIGQHMLLYNKKRKPSNWFNFDNCIQPNNLREYDAKKNFRLKYPLATIHLLLGILGYKLKINVPESSIPALLFVDGTFNVLFRYPENVLNWLSYLRADEQGSVLKYIFENDKYSVYELMVTMDKFFKQRDQISIPHERGDRLKISNTDSTPHNLISANTSYNLDSSATTRVLKFLELLSGLTEWKFNNASWTFGGFKLYKFRKGNLTLSNREYDAFIVRNPVSFAITSGTGLEYTMESSDKIL